MSYAFPAPDIYTTQVDILLHFFFGETNLNYVGYVEINYLVQINYFGYILFFCGDEQGNVNKYSILSYISIVLLLFDYYPRLYIYCAIGYLIIRSVTIYSFILPRNLYILIFCNSIPTITIFFYRYIFTKCLF